MVYIYIYKEISLNHREGNPSDTSTWMNTEDIMLSAINQSQNIA
jgi:hypothetical protein